MVKAGDRIRVQKYILGHRAYTEDYTVDEFRQCLGIFESEEARRAQNFTPICELYEPAPDAKKDYIPNYGECFTAYVPSYMNLPKAEPGDDGGR
jgi:hypothetical protein